MITRREFFSMASAAGVFPAIQQVPLIVPVHHVLDARAKWRPEQTHRFWTRIWPEAVRDFGWCGIRLQCSLRTGEVRRSPGGQPLFTGLDRGVINLVITDGIPMEWDNGRALSGVTTRYR